MEKIKKMVLDAEIVLASEPEEISQHIEDASIFLTFPGTVPDVRGAKNLKWIHSLSAGVERVLTPEIINSSILVSNSSGVHPIPIAEHVVGMMLIFTRRFYITFHQQLEKKWEKLMGLTELRGKIVLVIGLGHIGMEVARLSKNMGMEVIAADKKLDTKPDFLDELYSPDSLDEALAKADFVVLCLPHSQKTHHFFNREKLEKMKKEAYLINIARGGLVEEKGLIEVLKRKGIAGAGLDVTEEEPLPKDSPLWEMENVIITPHHSGWSEKYIDRATDIFCQNLKVFLEGKPLPNLVDKLKGY